jgi:hypothetical protein
MSFRIHTDNLQLTNQNVDENNRQSSFCIDGIIRMFENSYVIKTQDNNFIMNSIFTKTGFLKIYFYISIENTGSPEPEYDEVYSVTLNPDSENPDINNFGYNLSLLRKTYTYVCVKKINIGDKLEFLIKSELGTTFTLLQDTCLTIEFGLNRPISEFGKLI